MNRHQCAPSGRAHLGFLVLLATAAMAAGCQSSTSIEGDLGLPGEADAATDGSTADIGTGGAGKTGTTATETGDEATIEKECTTEADCPALPTNPANCAVAICNPQGVCTYAAKDADGDNHRSVGCRSTQRGFTVEVGDDCDDNDAETHPGAWDGPADDAHKDHCADAIDQNCSGADGDDVLPDGTNCTCKPGDTSTCSADPGGIPVTWPLGHPAGNCKYGSKICEVDAKTGKAKWTACVGVQGPAQEFCNGNIDDNCRDNGDDDAIDKSDYYCDSDSDNRLSAATNHVKACAEPADGCTGQWIANPNPSQFDDCDDTDSNVFTGHYEVCDGRDNNCNGGVDENAVDAPYWSYDADGDYYRSGSYPVLRQCDPPSASPAGCTGTCPVEAWRAGGTPLLAGDCDDGNASRNPAVNGDRCDGIDYNCDGSTTTGCSCSNGQTLPCNVHPGKDGIGICKAGIQTCTGGFWGGCVGAVDPKAETCGLADNDCDGVIGNNDPKAVDPSLGIPVTWACDADNDNHLSPAAKPPITGCLHPATACKNWVKFPALFDDCDDTDPNIHPGALERCNRKDDDCSSSAGKTTPSVVAAEDKDLDGHTALGFTGCSGGYPIDDCDDTNPDVHPDLSGKFHDVPYGCAGTYDTPCERDGNTTWACGNTNCSRLETPIHHASFDYNCDGVEERNTISEAECFLYNNSICVGGATPIDKTAPCGYMTSMILCTRSGSKCVFAGVPVSLVLNCR